MNRADPESSTTPASLPEQSGRLALFGPPPLLEGEDTDQFKPTPSSVAAAEGRLGELSPESLEATKEAMGRAREADRAGDQSACEQALAEVQRLIGP